MSTQVSIVEVCLTTFVLNNHVAAKHGNINDQKAISTKDIPENTQSGIRKFMFTTIKTKY